jgi:hypothetical protein
MTSDTLHPLAADYLQRLRRAGRGLPAGRRRELLADIQGHLSEAIEPGASDTEALTVLDKLGEPEEIVAAELPQPGDFLARRGPREWAAIVLLLVGGFVVGVGWVAGLILLWNSRAWTLRDKWIGTLLIPGGLATSVVIGLIAIGAPTKKLCQRVNNGAPRCVNDPHQHVPSSIGGVAIFVILVAAPLVTSVYLTRRAASR